jgi:hypothetical protein
MIRGSKVVTRDARQLESAGLRSDQEVDMAGNILGRLGGGPLDGQIIPLTIDDATQADEELVLPWDTGHLIYRRAGATENTGEHDGPTTVPYRFDSQI